MGDYLFDDGLLEDIYLNLGKLLSAPSFGVMVIRETDDHYLRISILVDYIVIPTHRVGDYLYEWGSQRNAR